MRVGWVLAVALAGTLGCDSGKGGEPPETTQGGGATDTGAGESSSGDPDSLGDGGQKTADTGQGTSSPGNDGKKSQEGETCTSSADCAGDLRCLGQECLCENPLLTGLYCDSCKEPGYSPPDCAPEWPRGGFGCYSDGYCNSADCSLSADPDCNPTAPCGGTPCGNNKWDPNCSCNYYGGTCETISKCSDAVCLCDTDCTPPDDSLKSACVSDGFCDSWCPTDQDPDCIGSPKNGAQCSKPSCNKKSGICNAKPGTTQPCTDDPDCTEGATACEVDGYCDLNCSAGADPDC